MSSGASKEPGLWSHDVPNQSPALVIISTVFLLITSVFFGLRTKERWKRRSRDSRPTFEGQGIMQRVRYESSSVRDFVVSNDTMAAAAYITLVIQTILGGLAAHYGFGKHGADIPSTFSTAMLYFFLCQICYKMLGGFTKLSFCFLYLKAMVYRNPDGLYQTHFKKLVMLTAYVTATGTFAFTVVTVFQCTPARRAWDRRVSGHCIDNLPFWFSHAAFNTLMDIIVFLLPLPIVFNIKAARKVRYGLMATFALGAFVIAASIARMANLEGSAGSTADPTWGSMPALVWTEVEANTAVIVCCCPALPHLMKKLWRRMREVVGQSVSLDSGAHKPSHPTPEQSGHSTYGTPSSPDSRSRPGFLSGLCMPLIGIWRRVTGQPTLQDSTDVEHGQVPYYTSGNFTTVQALNKKQPCNPCPCGSDRDDDNPWTGDEAELTESPGRLAPKVKLGGLYKKPTRHGGSIHKQTEVLVSSHRRPVVREDDEHQMQEFRRQNTERQEHDDRIFAKLDSARPR